MSVENVKKFYEDLSKDEKLKEKVLKMQEELNLSKDASEQDVSKATVSIARKLGYDFSKDDLKEYSSSHEMSDDMLESVTGGGVATCFCAVAGGGGGNAGSCGFCLCPIAGAGGGYDKDKKGKVIETLVCACVAGGYGETF